MSFEGKQEKNPEQNILYVEDKEFRQIRDGSKKWDVRFDINRDFEFAEGVKITYKNSQETEKKITIGEVRNYNDIKQLLDDIPVAEVFPGREIGEIIAEWEKQFAQKDLENFAIVACKVN